LRVKGLEGLLAMLEVVRRIDELLNNSLKKNAKNSFFYLGKNEKRTVI
jgi:hypothetical protein